MSPRKTILKELDSAGSHTRPSTIHSFATAPDKYQKAVNQLLQDRMLGRRDDDDGHMTMAINEHRRSDVRKELRPIWAHPGMWATLALITTAVGAGFKILRTSSLSVSPVNVGVLTCPRAAQLRKPATSKVCGFLSQTA